MKFIFVRVGFYSDIPIPFTRRYLVLDVGWDRIDGEWVSLWALGWAYR